MATLELDARVGEEHSRRNYFTALKRKNRENIKLKNRIQRYQKRLLKQALTKAKDEDLKTIIYTLIPQDRIDDSTIALHKDHNDYVDINPILELVKDDLPSLYRRYHSAVQRYEINLRALDKLTKRKH